MKKDRERQILYDMGNLKNTQTSEYNKKEADPQITTNKLSGYQWGERSGAGEERGWGVGGINYYKIINNNNSKIIIIIIKYNKNNNK